MGKEKKKEEERNNTAKTIRVVMPKASNKTM
jgi:hypothetical protein